MGYQMIIMFVVMAGLIFYMNRTQEKQAEKRMESLNKLQKGYEVITIGGKNLEPQSGRLSAANSLTTDSSFSVNNSLSAANFFPHIGILCCSCGAFCS